MEKPTWLEVSLIVDGEMAEAVADVLARFAPDGVVIESTAIESSANDVEGHPIGPLRVAGYLVMDSQIEDTRRRLEESLWYLGRIRELPAPEFKPVQQTDWSEAWKEHYRPIPIGQKLTIVPAWLNPETSGRIPIRIDPGMAFGTGTHPTTQLCLEMIEYHYLNTPPRTVIDLGCGSGILSIAALKLGAERALGVDIDADAIRSAQKNALANQVGGNLELGLGSLSEVQRGDFSLKEAPLVLANILAPILIRLLDDGLAKILTPDGLLVLSGILAEQASEVQAALENHGLRLIEQRQIEDWVAISASLSTSINPA
jgi:ribosomal protein L11 methyltransferase